MCVCICACSCVSSVCWLVCVNICVFMCVIRVLAGVCVALGSSVCSCVSSLCSSMLAGVCIYLCVHVFHLCAHLCVGWCVWAPLSSSMCACVCICKCVYACVYVCVSIPCVPTDPLSPIPLPLHVCTPPLLQHQRYGFRLPLWYMAAYTILCTDPSSPSPSVNQLLGMHPSALAMPMGDQEEVGMGGGRRETDDGARGEGDQEENLLALAAKTLRWQVEREMNGMERERWKRQQVGLSSWGISTHLGW